MLTEKLSNLRWLSPSKPLALFTDGFDELSRHNEVALNKSLFFQRVMHPDLLHGSITKPLLCFTFPLFVSYIFQQLYNAMDTIIIARLLDENALVSIGACTALYDLLVGFGVGFGNGLGIVAAKAFGAGDFERLKKITASSIIITFFVTAFITLFSFFFLEPIMILLKTPADRIQESLSYISVIMKFCGVLFAYNLFSSLLRSIGNSFVPLLFLIFSSVLNIILDVFFIKSTNSIQGAAVATVLSQLVSAVFCLFYIFWKAKKLVPSQNHFKIDFPLYKDLAGQGLSMAVMGAIVHMGTVILQSAINSLDQMVIAGHLCARKIFTLTNIPIMTLGLSLSTFVSQNLGAGQITRIKKSVKISILLTTLCAAVLFVPALFFVENLIKLISNSQNPILVGYAKNYILFTVPFYVVLGGLIILRNALQGLGQKILPLVSSLIEFAGKIIFTLLVIPVLGSWGVVLCEPLIWCVMFLQLAFVYVKVIQNLKHTQ